MTEFTSALKIMKSMDCRLKTYRKRDEVLAKSTEKRFKYLIKYQTKLKSFKIWNSLLLAKSNFLFTRMMASD
jgi:hypothetical protein